MKKLSLMLLAAVFCAGMLLVAGCGKKDDGKKKLIVATDANFPPYVNFENGKLNGIDVEIVTEIAKNLGYELDFIDMKIDAVLLAVAKDKCNLGACTLTITEERKETVDFSIPYATTTQIVLVPMETTIGTLEDLKNEKIRVGVQQGSASDTYFTKHYGIPERFGTVGNAVDALLAKRIDAVTCDRELAEVYCAKNPGKLQILPMVLVEKEYAFAFSKNNAKLREKFNAELEKMQRSGRLQEIIHSHLHK